MDKADDIGKILLNLIYIGHYIVTILWGVKNAN